MELLSKMMPSPTILTTFNAVAEDTLIHWAAQASNWAIMISLVAAVLLGVFQPRHYLRWFSLCFATIFFCVASLSIDGGIRHQDQADAASAKVSFVFGGVSLVVAGIFLIVFLNAAKRVPDEEAPSDEDACTRHARRMSIGSFIGFFSGAGCAIALNHWGLLSSTSHWGDFLLIILFSSGPVVILAFIFPPPCPSCQKGHMMLRGTTPVRYRCKSCDYAVRTEIRIGSRRFGAD